MILFLAEWTLRSAILILSGALLLRMLRVKDPSIRLAAWTAMLCGSLAVPALTVTLPKMAMPHLQAARPGTVLPSIEPPLAAHPAGTAPQAAVSWAQAAIILYSLIAGGMLMRLCAGLALSMRLLRNSRATGQETEGIEIRDSDRVTAPVTLGIIRPVIVLPGNWREWNSVKLDAVLAHERSHVRRFDPAVQLLSVIHRALLWHCPLSWFLDRQIVRAAEEASDDAAVAASQNRELYAEVLLDFMRTGVRETSWRRADCDGVAMARYGLPEKRIQRILDATTLTHGITRWSVAAIVALGSPLVYVVATAQPQAVTPQLTYESGADGYLMHRGTNDQDVTAFMDIGGIPFQEKAFELRSRIRNFVLFRRDEHAYLIEDPETVRRAWKELDDGTACGARVEAATPFPDELRKALAACQISDAELTAARNLKETQRLYMKSVIEIVTESRKWKVLDLSISDGTARPIEP